MPPNLTRKDKIGKKQTIHIVEVEDDFAVIDREQGTISVMDKENLAKYQAGEEYECSVSKTVVSSRSWGGWNPGDGKPPWAVGGRVQREMDLEEL